MENSQINKLKQKGRRFLDRRNGKKLKFIALSGTTGVTESFFVYEYGNDMIIVDCGVGFPEPDMYGVDLVIPDFSYIKENRHKLRGILITHGHEDHLGALPFLLDQVSAPVYASKLTIGFIDDKLKDYGVKKHDLHVIDVAHDVLTLGVFKVSSFRVSHSVPDTLAYVIDTPVGTLFHVSDYKFDWTPVDGKPFDVLKAATLASRGVLAMASDCLGSTHAGYTESERAIEGRLEPIINNAKGQVFFTTISSNISRMQQAMNVAQKEGRRVCLVGRSIEHKAEIARDLGYLKWEKGLVVGMKQARRLKKNEIVYIVSGSYGQPGSALYRVAMGEHQFMKAEREDTVIFSGDPAPPGSKANVDFLVDRLLELEVDVHYYDMQEDLHVSGHGSQQDITMLLGIVKPKFLVPIGGTIRHMRGYRLLAKQMGYKDQEVLELTPGTVIEYSENNARVAGKVPVQNVLVDGLGIGDVGNVVLRDRQKLANDGIAIVVLQLDKNKEKLIDDPVVFSRGFVFEKETKDFLNFSGKKLREKLGGRRIISAGQLRNETVDFLERFYFEQTGRRPMVLPVVVEV